MVKVVHALCVLSGLLVAGPVMASPIAVGHEVQVIDRDGTTGGGEFLLIVNNEEAFISFCLQRTEYIDYTTAFRIGGVSASASTDAPEHGGDDNGHDPLSSQTAWLYTQFRAGALGGYDYDGPDRWASADALQNAIWWFEGELADNPSNAFVLAAESATASGWTGLGSVYALNLYFPDGREAQDQLALIAGTTPVAPVVVAPVPTPAPEPTSLVLLGSGLALASRRRWYYRGKRKQAPTPSAQANLVSSADGP